MDERNNKQQHTTAQRRETNRQDDANRRGGANAARNGARATHAAGAKSKTGSIRGIFSRRPSNSKPHKPNAITRLATQWCNRLLGVVHDRSFHEQESQYEASRTTQDYLWNTIGMGAWGVVFPVLTIVVTQLQGAENAGMFSMAFVVASLLMILANFGIRTFQISDVNEEYSFADYRINRLITVLLSILVGFIYCALRGYDGFMSTMVMGLVVYKAMDGFADVYEGRLQQMGKMYLAGISLTVRSAAVFLVFCIALLISDSLPVASVCMAIASAAGLVVVSLPLAHLETPKSEMVSIPRVIGLFKHSWPLFAALFMYALIDNMPKFVMESMLTYDNQLYYNALYFPAMFILMTAQSIYKPMLVRMANVWHDPSKRRRFDLIILAVVVCIIVLTAAMSAIMLLFGLDILGFLYGLDFRPYEKVSILMLIAGGITAGIDFLYQTITILRRQKDVVVAYLIALVLSLFTPMLLIEFAQLEGAVLSYLIVMTVLFILMLWVYFRIRFTKEGRASLEEQEAEDAKREQRRHAKRQKKVQREQRKQSASDRASNCASARTSSTSGGISHGTSGNASNRVPVRARGCDGPRTYDGARDFDNARGYSDEAIHQPDTGCPTNQSKRVF